MRFTFNSRVFVRIWHHATRRNTISCIQHRLTWWEIGGDNVACRVEVLVVSDSKFHVVVVVADTLQCHFCVRDFVDRYVLPNSAALMFVVYNNSYNVIAPTAFQLLNGKIQWPCMKLWRLKKFVVVLLRYSYCYFIYKQDLKLPLFRNLILNPMSIVQNACFSVCFFLPVRRSDCLFACPRACLYVPLVVCLFCLFVCLFVCLFLPQLFVNFAYISL